MASYHFIFTYYYVKTITRQAIIRLGEFAYGVGSEILNPYVALQVWAGAPGIADLAITADSDAPDRRVVTVLIGKGDRTFQSPQNLEGGVSPNLLPIGDVDRDGIQDLTVTDRNGSQLWLLLGKGDGKFQDPQPFIVGMNPAGVTVEDFNRDGRLDVTVANAGSDTVSVLLNDIRP